MYLKAKNMKRLATEKEWRELLRTSDWTWGKIASPDNKSEFYGWTVTGPSKNSIQIFVFNKTTRGLGLDDALTMDALQNPEKGYYIPGARNATFFIQTDEENPRIQNSFVMMNDKTRTLMNHISIIDGYVHLVSDTPDPGFVDLGLSVYWQVSTEPTEIMVGAQQVRRVLRKFLASDVETYVQTAQKYLIQQVTERSDNLIKTLKKRCDLKLKSLQLEIMKEKQNLEKSEKRIQDLEASRTKLKNAIGSLNILKETGIL